MPIDGIGYVSGNPSGKLKEKAMEHQKFLSRRKRAGSEGIDYPLTRGTSEILAGTPSPTVQGGVTGFKGLGSRHR